MIFIITFFLVLFALLSYIISFMFLYLELPSCNTDLSKINYEPLSFNYINNAKLNKRALYNKKTMNNDIQKENLLLLKEFLESQNIRYYIDCGTLLGAVRDKDLIKGDTDADVMISKASVEELRSKIYLLEKQGFISFRNSRWWLPMSLLRKGEYIDIYSFWWHIPFETIDYPFLGTFFPVPKFYEEYLTEAYRNWKVPSNDKGPLNWERGMIKYVKKHTVPNILDFVVHFRYKPYIYIKWLNDYKRDCYLVDKSVNLNKLPLIFKEFDYEIHGTVASFFCCFNRARKNVKDAKVVYCYPEKALSYGFNQFSDLEDGEKRVLIAMGEDTKSSKLSINQKNKILRKFSTVFWEANNDSSFLTLPMGFNACYVSLHGLDKTEIAIKKAVDKQKSKLLVIPAWNKFSTELENPNRRVSSRTRLGKFVSETKNEEWYDFVSICPNDYYKTISDYKFMICPTGNGIQAPKIFESILVRTIPIVEDELCFHQLKEMGIPLLIVKNWSDLSEEFLMNVSLSVDWEEAIRLFSVKGVTDIIYSKL